MDAEPTCYNCTYAMKRIEDSKTGLPIQATIRCCRPDKRYDYALNIKKPPFRCSKHEPRAALYDRDDENGVLTREMFESAMKEMLK